MGNVEQRKAQLCRVQSMTEGEHDTNVSLHIVTIAGGGIRL